MARITFVENRGKTAFWVHVARELRRNGHSISWIIQNHAYRPLASDGRQICIPYPETADHEFIGIPEAVSTDRGCNYFGGCNTHYAYYTRAINDALDELSPDVVIGEPTLFHELLIISECRARKIPYLHPTMTRYPGGRFNILDCDTQNVAIASQEQWSEEKVVELASSIAGGRSLPSYMRSVSKLDWQLQKVKRLSGLARTTFGWLGGERYNTPSPIRKRKLGQELKSRLNDWKGLARLPDDRGPVVLYPLQMQPEANIDVWGRPYSDQVGMVSALLDAVPANGSVAVKANPKSKYEVSSDLIALARREPRVVLLPLDMKMDAAHERCLGTITVSGTVGFEAVFGRGRCLSLRHPILQEDFPTFHATSPEDAVDQIFSNKDAGCGDLRSGVALLRKLISGSFPGTINEPLYDADCVTDENIARVAGALEQAILYKTEKY